jgi:DNA-binding NarL/FixJ family response regulator
VVLCGRFEALRVLLVEDSEVFRDALAQLAVAAGLEIVGEAASGEEAIELFAALSPGAIVMDVRLPGMSGYDVADRVLAAAPQTRVVLVSATEGVSDARVLPKSSLTPAVLRAALEHETVA